MTYSSIRPRTRRKTEVCKDLHEGIYKTNGTRWLAMGGLYANISPVSRTYVLLLLIIIGTLAESVSCCDVDSCWDEFQIAKETLNNEHRHNNADIHCISLRTYFQCLDTLRSCKGDIKFHSAKKGVVNLMKQNRCTSNGPTYTLKDNDIALPPDALCTFQGEQVYRNCALFGDPHLRTFNNEFQTCKINGAWPLVNNEHLTVQVSNEQVPSHIGATATTKLTVLVKKNMECASPRYVMYQAQSTSLPSTFDDGETAYGKSRSVELIEIIPGKHVEIRVKYIETQIVIRLVGHYLTFAITMPEELVNSSDHLQLCERGCPQSEIINYQEFLALKKKKVASEVNVMPRIDAEKLCRDSGVVDFFFDSCVFDMITTGNENFTIAAYMSMQDLLRLAPDAREKQENRTSLDKYDALYGNAMTVRTTCFDFLRILVLTVITCIFTTHAST